MHRIDSVPPEKIIDETTDPPLCLQLRCQPCGRRFQQEFAWAVVSPENAMANGDWDGVVLSSIVECPGCGAVDEYRIEPMSLLRLSASLLAEAAAGHFIALGLTPELPTDKPTILQRLLSDGANPPMPRSHSRHRVSVWRALTRRKAWSRATRRVLAGAERSTSDAVAGNGGDGSAYTDDPVAR